MSDLSRNSSIQPRVMGRDNALQGSPENNSVTILTVDDNDALRYSLSRFLREAGYRVMEAKTGREALALAEKSPDLITLDVNLPDITGFDVCRQLKSNPPTAHIPILHVSATFVDSESKVRGLEGGADAYLAEPIDRAELVATVGALLRLKNAETAARLQAGAAESARRELAQLNATLESRVSARTAELKAANDSLRELSARLLQIRDDERRRLARELHDSIGQLLAAIGMNNTSIRGEETRLSPRAAKALVENESLVQEVMRSIRTISHLLHPPLLDEAGLPSALRWYVEEFSKRSGIKVVLNCPASLERFPSEFETTIFRVVQECLGNVHRHSESPTATIRFDIRNMRAFLEVSDEGVGIPAGTQQDLRVGGRLGVGLRGIRERVAQLGGDLQINSSGKGTAVSVEIPCRPIGSSPIAESV